MIFQCKVDLVLENGRLLCWGTPIVAPDLTLMRGGTLTADGKTAQLADGCYPMPDLLNFTHEAAKEPRPSNQVQRG